jgi:hypothetical protein
MCGSQCAVYRQQLDLRVVGDQLLDRIENIDQMRPIGADRRNSNPGPPVQLKMINFGHAELKSPSYLRNQGAYQRSLLLE